MESKQQPNLVMKGYETYAVLKGGEKVIQFSDNSDIVTDKEASAVEVVPKGKKDPIKFIPRGRNNDMMYDIMRKSAPMLPLAVMLNLRIKSCLGTASSSTGRNATEKPAKSSKRKCFRKKNPKSLSSLRTITSTSSVSNSLMILSSSTMLI